MRLGLNLFPKLIGWLVLPELTRQVSSAGAEDDDGEWDDDWDDQSVSSFQGNGHMEEEAGASGRTALGPSVKISLNKYMFLKHYLYLNQSWVSAAVHHQGALKIPVKFIGVQYTSQYVSQFTSQYTPVYSAVCITVYRSVHHSILQYKMKYNYLIHRSIGCSIHHSIPQYTLQ